MTTSFGFLLPRAMPSGRRHVQDPISTRRRRCSVPVLGLFCGTKEINCSREVQLTLNVARPASIVFICVMASFGGEPRTAWAQTALSVEVLSSRPELVTGGDALVRITAPEAPQVTVGAGDVSAAFRRDQKGG